MEDRNYILANLFGTIGMLQMSGKVFIIEGKLLEKIHNEYCNNPSTENYARLKERLNKIADRAMHK